uniref:Glycosyltransferase n=1 Tax=Leersia perrieri TaxID=77586 RepID=A0A0D9WYM8_9ORYZ
MEHAFTAPPPIPAVLMATSIPFASPATEKIGTAISTGNSTGRTVVMYPGVGVGHLLPMVELAKVFIRHGLAVTVALVEPPPRHLGLPGFSAAVARVAADNPSVTFHVLPSPPPPPAADDGNASTGGDVVQAWIQHLDAMNAPLRDFLRAVAPPPRALVLDMFCFGALDVAAELDLPAYFFYPSGAGAVAVLLNLPTIINAGFNESTVNCPGVPPFKPSELPTIFNGGESETAKCFLRMSQRMAESSGILVNSFESLETRAVQALRNGLCVAGGRVTPPVYCIGPLVSGGNGGEHECLRWLDDQPDKSVVFLSFGSRGTFPKRQLEEIATGLEMSGQKFLWVVRSPDAVTNDDKAFAAGEPDLDELLPQGFLERTKGRGMVVKSWAPQVEVLRHRACGAFVTHCGWNSIIEGITAGVPLLCWPLYAEQRLNKVLIVEGMELGVEMVGYDEEIVAAEEVEAKVRWVMESDGGHALRRRAAAAKEAAAEALEEGGTSYMAYVQFLEDQTSNDRTKLSI